MSNEPDIIRQNAPHQISVTEGSQVAASRSLDPHPPQVRKVLADQGDEPADGAPPEPELPPPLSAAGQAASGQVFERHADLPQSLLRVPDAGPAPTGEEALVFERALHDSHSSAEPVPPARPADGAPVLTHAIEDRFEPLPAEALSLPRAEGPTDGVAWQDRRVQTDALPPPPSVPPSLLTREVAADLPGHAAKAPVVPDNWQQLPPAEGRPLAVPPSMAEPRVEPTLEPVPTAQAEAELVETARQAQAKVEETLGSADPQWVEMDFPARVVRLKIENDKVRSRLDQLETLSHPSKR